MPRVSWGESGRVRRLSAYAVQLLRLLCEPGASITYAMTSGQYQLPNGVLVHSKTVEVLASPRLITRLRDGVRPVYVITERGRDTVRAAMVERCAAAGHDPDTCHRPTCLGALPIQTP
jgi:hypothetical protein